MHDSYDTDAKGRIIAVAVTLHPSIAAKSILITGITPNSLGAEFALNIAAYAPSQLLLASRTPSALATVAAGIAAQHPSVAVTTFPLDLSSLFTVRTTAAAVLAHLAATAATLDVLAADGHESQLATSHLGPFMPTKLLLPVLTLGVGRAVNVASSGHAFGTLDYAYPNFALAGEGYDPWAAYGASKSPYVLFRVALAACGGPSWSLHPGGRICTGAVGLISADGAVRNKQSNPLGPDTDPKCLDASRRNAEKPVS
ncbi:short chain dehydrogenase reductase [Geopyxis carbonaria]|nr:short chain dehydrogenase reductase [Geopyxis carbonaria]